MGLRSENMNNIISMRISTSIKSEENFYTDLNGFQVGIDIVLIA